VPELCRATFPDSPRLIGPSWLGLLLNRQFPSHGSGVRFSRIYQPPVARYASLTGG